MSVFPDYQELDEYITLKPNAFYCHEQLFVLANGYYLQLNIECKPICVHAHHWFQTAIYQIS